MAKIKVNKIKKIKGKITAPADKSISQRAIMLASLSSGETIIDNILDCDDCNNAIKAFTQLGIKFKKTKQKNKYILKVDSKGADNFKQPKQDLYIGNSGTTMRLIAGILSGLDLKVKLTADPSLSKRPMKRIIDPLRKMNAKIKGRKKNGQEYPPLQISPSEIKPISFNMKLKSAQVKSSVLLAGMFAKGTTVVKEILKTRDHTERMLKLFGADIKVKGLSISLKGKAEIKSPEKIYIPGDISSAAFFIVAASLINGSSLTIEKVGLNPSRTGFLDIMRRMNADIKIIKKTARLKGYEPYADLKIRSSRLRAVTIKPKEVAYCIDELPIICVAACFAQGTTKIIGASELRVKETDRIYSMVTNLKKMGADIKNSGDDLIIKGGAALNGAIVDSYGDHRTVMCMAVAGLLAQGPTTITNSQCIAKSFPDFIKILRNITELT